MLLQIQIIKKQSILLVKSFSCINIIQIINNNKQKTTKRMFYHHQKSIDIVWFSSVDWIATGQRCAQPARF